jgi:hypothetical protein
MKFFPKRSYGSPRIEVADWPKELNVGDLVMYQHKKRRIVAKFSDEWHWDKPTFILRQCWSLKTIEV